MSRYIKELSFARVLEPVKVEIRVEPTAVMTADLSAAMRRRRERNLRLLEECREMWDALKDFREMRKRCRDYAYGRQWEDLIPDPDNCGKMISERDYMMREGKMPLENNLIRKLVKIVLGVYRSDRREPMALTRDKDESKLGDMMSVALQYAYQTNDAYELNTRNLEEALVSGMVISSTRYAWNAERRMFDVRIENENPTRVFFNGGLQDPRGTDIHTIGFLRDYTLRELIGDFARDPREAEWLRGLWAKRARRGQQEGETLDARRWVDGRDFYLAEGERMRVIEIWKMETRERLRCHDIMRGETYVAETNREREIQEENARRAMDILSQGGTEEDVPLIRYEWFVDSFWTVRYLTADGDELLAMETPFEHRSHPYTIRMYTMFDGEVHSFVNDIIPQQKYINRYITMMDFIRGASAKGVLIFPEALKPKNVNYTEICKTWVKSNGVIFADMKPGMPMPQQFNSTAVNTGDVEMLQLQMNLLDEISGVHAALAGKSAKAGTPGSLYAQEAQNANNNLLDLLEWSMGFVRARDYKLMKTIQQFYKEKRYINIAGHEFSDTAKWYDPDKIRQSDFDIAISEATSTPIYRMVLNDTLNMMLQQGAIDIKLYLQNSKLPFAAQMLKDIEAREQAMAQQQAQQGGVDMNGATMPGVEASNPITPEMREKISAQANPAAQHLIDQAMNRAAHDKLAAAGRGE